MTNTANSRKAKHGEKMIELKVRFWTNGIADKQGWVVPKNGWSRGMVIMERNESHEIVPKDPRPFNSLMELPQVIEKVLIEHDIKLHREGKAGNTSYKHGYTLCQHFC